MAGSPDIPIGERIRFYRQARKKTQAVVAGLAGISEDYLSQIERGRKTPSTTLLHRFAHILVVPVSALLGGDLASVQTSDGVPVGSELNRALITSLNSSDASTRSAVDIVDLRTRVGAAWSAWQSSPRRYSEVSPLLPALVRDVELTMYALRSSNDVEARRGAQRVAADLYFLLRTFTKRIGRTDLSLLAADRGLRAAEDADDVLRIAAARWNLGQVLLATGDAGAAEDVAMHGSVDLPQDSEDWRVLALGGALWLVATVAAARTGDTWKARDLLRKRASPAAELAGEGNAFWTVFGPTNVGLHALSIEMEAGETAEALRLADKVNVARCPSIERRVTFSLELARCYELRREDAGVLLHLLAAEREAPEDMRYNPLARTLARRLLQRARPSMLPQVQEMAERVHLFT